MWRWLGLVLLASLISVAMGCGLVPAVVADGRDTPNEVSIGGAYVPAGFGAGSLWATDILACDDTSVFGPFGGDSGACAYSGPQFLKRLDPGTGEVEARIPLEDFFANTPEVAFGAGSVWVSSADYGPGPVGERQPWDAVYRIDPEKNRVVDRIPVDSPTGVAFGHGSAWAVSAGHGTLSRIDPETGEVTAEIEVGRGAVDVAADERFGAVWVAGLYLPKDGDGGDRRTDPGDRKLSRVDPETNRVVAEIPVRAGSPDGGAQGVAVGDGAVWATSVDGRLLKVDPATNGVIATIPLGEYSSHLAVSGGSVWVSGQNSGTWLKRVNPRTAEIDWSRGLGSVASGGYGRLAGGGGHLWFVETGVWAGEGGGELARLAP